ARWWGREVRATFVRAMGTTGGTTTLPHPPVVTVVIPVRNRPRLLEECLRSIREPDTLRWEAIVVDDGSEEDLAGVVTRLGDPRITHTRQAPRGASAARNLGMSLARGRFVKFLDSDDELEPDVLARQAAALE